MAILTNTDSTKEFLVAALIVSVITDLMATVLNPNWASRMILEPDDGVYKESVRNILGKGGSTVSKSLFTSRK